MKVRLHHNSVDDELNLAILRDPLDHGLLYYVSVNQYDIQFIDKINSCVLKSLAQTEVVKNGSNTEYHIWFHNACDNYSIDQSLSADYLFDLVILNLFIDNLYCDELQLGDSADVRRQCVCYWLQNLFIISSGIEVRCLHFLKTWVRLSIPCSHFSKNH